MNLNDYSYELPSELIAQKPFRPRDRCKLLILDKDSNHKRFDDIIDYLKKDDVLVLNDTKVTHSKIYGHKETGSKAELILLKKIPNSDNTFEAKIKTKNPLVGNKILFKKGFATIISQKNIDTFVVKFSNPKIIDEAVLPTPPYIKNILKDFEYQTIFSKKQGSLAAPTAGLHFTKQLLRKIEKKGIKIVYITLHVSYGTFKNIDDINKYVMDPEYYEISEETAKTINNRKGRLIVCGTTTLKALETASKKINNKNGKIIPKKEFSTLFIYPPYKFKSGTDILITNFHLPKSTLLLLTCAFGGRNRILKAYNEAVKKKYRFFSLGDAMMIYNNKKE